MKTKFIGVSISLLILMIAVATASANGKGNTPGHLQDSGWACMNVPGLGVHCFPPGSEFGAPSMPVKVYHTDDPSSYSAEFLGTEILIRADIYNGQPCPQSGLEEYDALDLTGDGITDYYACHHYDHSGE